MLDTQWLSLSQAVSVVSHTDTFRAIARSIRTSVEVLRCQFSGFPPAVMSGTKVTKAKEYGVNGERAAFGNHHKCILCNPNQDNEM